MVFPKFHLSNLPNLEIYNVKFNKIKRTMEKSIIIRFFKKNIYLLLEKERECVGQGRERGKESLKQTPR